MSTSLTQPALYVFVLRKNISLEGDLQLARMELESLLCRSIRPLPDTTAYLRRLLPEIHPQKFDEWSAFSRVDGLEGYEGEGTLDSLVPIVRRASFIQRVVCVTPLSDRVDGLSKILDTTVGPVWKSETVNDRVLVWAIPHYALYEYSGILVRQSRNPAHTQKKLNQLLPGLLNSTVDPQSHTLANTVQEVRSTSAHLSHGIHYYKAKFFPRLARSMLNICSSRMADRSIRVLDNFAGSGTTLLEASTLGLDSVGVDVDPLSVLIAKAKMDALCQDTQLIEREGERVIARLEKSNPVGRDSEPCHMRAPAFEFPDWLLKNRKMTTEHSVTLSQEIEWAGRAISDCHPSVRQLFRVLFSDAIARRIRMRFLGTGVGRFSLTLSKFTIQQLLVRSINRYTKIAIAADWLRTVTHLDLAPTSMIESDARSLPFGQNSFNLVLTSPPYLPASSGRESYAMARAPSLVALGYRYANEIDALSNHSIGAMKVSSTSPDSLSPDERHLVNWLQRDPLRKIKAQPTARYFMDMRASFAEMHRILEPGGICAVVSGKQNTFYRFSDRKILYVAETAKWLAQEAELVGLKVEDSYDLQLVKPNRNARPRSLDDYYETILIFSKPH